jgi:hypothetical protein
VRERNKYTKTWRERHRLLGKKEIILGDRETQRETARRRDCGKETNREMEMNRQRDRK